MKRLIFLVFVVIWCFSMVGCSSTLRNVERDNSLDRIEAMKGQENQDDNFSQRQEALAEQEIRDRKVIADTNRGYKVLIVNESRDEVTIEIRKFSWFNCFSVNPLTARFVFYGKSHEEHCLMPGKYDVSCYLGDIPRWSKVYEVTTAPQWDGQANEYYHCIIRNLWVSCNHSYDRPLRVYRRH